MLLPVGWLKSPTGQKPVGSKRATLYYGEMSPMAWVTIEAPILPPSFTRRREDYPREQLLDTVSKRPVFSRSVIRKVSGVYI